MRERWRDLRLAGGGTTGRATRILIGVQVLLYVACLVVPAFAPWIAVGTYPGFRFEYWRPLVYGLTATQLLQLLLTLVAVWFVGRSIESALGSGNFAALYLLSGLGAGTVLTLGGPLAASGGAFSGVLGVLAASAVAKRRAHQDIRGDVAVMVLLVLMGFLGGGGLLVGSDILAGQWIGDLGALAVGAGVGVVQASSGGNPRALRRGYTALAAVCAVALTLVWALPPRWGG